MNITDILSDKHSLQIQLFKTESYVNVYKKTEKIACAVFLLTDEISKTYSEKDIISDTKRAAKDFLAAVVDALVRPPVQIAEADIVHVVKQATLLRSFLFILASTRLLRGDLLDVLTNEIDAVLRNIGPIHSHAQVRPTLEETLPHYIERGRRRGGSRTVPQHAPKDEGGDTSGRSRRDTILAIVREKGSVSVKDIAGLVTDCSEKTIQRELLGLISLNLVSKEGDRRWSKYKAI